MGTVLTHPTKEQEALLAEMRAMRALMRDDDPEIDAEAAAVHHMLLVSEAYWRQQSDKLWKVIYVLVFLVGVLGASVLLCAIDR